MFPDVAPLDGHWNSSSRPAATLLDAHERQSKLGDRVAHEVPRPVVGEIDEDDPAIDRRLEAGADQGVGERRGAVLDLDREPAGPLRERRQRRGAHEPAGIDRDEEVADPLDLAEEVAGHDDRDPELGAGPPDQGEHLVAARRVEAVGRFVEQQQPRVVDQRLGQLDPLLHAGRVAPDRPVAFLVQPDVAEHLGRALAGGRRREPGQAGHLADEIGGGHVGRQAVGFGHVPDELAKGRALRADVVAEDAWHRPRSAAAVPAGSG